MSPARSTSRPAAAPPSPRALLLEGVHPAGERLLADAGWSVRTTSGALGPDTLADALDDVQLLGLRSATQLTADVLERAPSLVAVGAFCIGTAQIDMAAAARRGVAVFNAPYSNSRSVVEMALGQIIALARRLPDAARSMRDGVWHKTAVGAHEVRGRHLGIVGYGNIGSQLSVMAEALGMTVRFFDTAERPALGNARRCTSLDELLAESDVLSLHVDGRPRNAGLIGARELDLLPPGALLLNLSRGPVVDHSALYDALVGGRLAGAAIDVFPDEPRERRHAFRSDLRTLPNVILTPHIGGSTEEAQYDIGQFVARKLREYVECGDTSLSVNLPALSAGRPAAATRLTHLHANTPGVLAGINAILADGRVNVVGQHLATRDDLGYVITDVAECPAATVTRLRRLPGTVRVAVPGPARGLHVSAPLARGA